MDELELISIHKICKENGNCCGKLNYDQFWLLQCLVPLWTFCDCDSFLRHAWDGIVKPVNWIKALQQTWRRMEKILRESNDRFEKESKEGFEIIRGLVICQNCTWLRWVEMKHVNGRRNLKWKISKNASKPNTNIRLDLKLKMKMSNQVQNNLQKCGLVGVTMETWCFLWKIQQEMILMETTKHHFFKKFQSTS